MTLDDVAGLDPDYACLIDYWRGKCRSASCMPTLSDFDLMELYPIAPRLVVIDVERTEGSPLRYKWRYAGTILREAIGIEMTGRYLDEVADEKTIRQSIEAYAPVVERREANYWERSIGIQAFDRSYIVYSRLVLPLRGHGDTIDHMIGVYVFDETTNRHTPPQPQQWRIAARPDPND